MQIKINIADFTRFQKKIKKFGLNSDTIVNAGLKELSGRLLAKVTRKTPVGKSIKGLKVLGEKTGELQRFKKGKNKGKVKYKKQVIHTGGNLRRSWYASNIYSYENIKCINVYNTASYARYVEYGHTQTPGRFVPAIGKRLKASWVTGRFMLTRSTTEIENIKEKVLMRKLNEEIDKIWK